MQPLRTGGFLRRLAGGLLLQPAGQRAQCLDCLLHLRQQGPGLGGGQGGRPGAGCRDRTGQAGQADRFAGVQRAAGSVDIGQDAGEVLAGVGE